MKAFGKVTRVVAPTGRGGNEAIDENVHAAAGFINKANTEDVVTLIRESGFMPAQRTTLYDILKVYGDN